MPSRYTPDWQLVFGLKTLSNNPLPLRTLYEDEFCEELAESIPVLEEGDGHTLNFQMKYFSRTSENVTIRTFLLYALFFCDNHDIFLAQKYSWNLNRQQSYVKSMCVRWQMRAKIQGSLLSILPCLASFLAPTYVSISDESVSTYFAQCAHTTKLPLLNTNNALLLQVVRVFRSPEKKRKEPSRQRFFGSLFSSPPPTPQPQFWF